MAPRKSLTTLKSGVHVGHVMVFGKYSIRLDNQVMVIHCYGCWNATTALQFIEEFKRTAQYIYQSSWAHIVFFDDWVLSTPDCEAPVNDMLKWAVRNKMTHSVRIYREDALKSYQLNRMMDERDNSHVIRHFYTEEEGFNWLAESGYLVEQPRVVA